MGLYSGGLIIRGIFASEIWGSYIREGIFIYLFIYLFLEGEGGGGGLLSEFYGIHVWLSVERIQIHDRSTW